MVGVYILVTLIKLAAKRFAVISMIVACFRFPFINGWNSLHKLRVRFRSLVLRFVKVLMPLLLECLEPSLC